MTKKQHMNVGTIGHVDHGKTTLTAALCTIMSHRNGGKTMRFVDIDRAPEERRRGVTIIASHVRYESSSRIYAHVDCPGHADYVKNMITGASQMDAGVLLIDGTQGAEAQTREHIVLARQVGVQHLVVFVNKADIAQPEMLELVEMEARDLLEEYAYHDVPFVTGSALQALEAAEAGRFEDPAVACIVLLVDALDVLPAPVRKLEGAFLMPIEGVCSIQGLGTVVTGCVERGVLRVGDAIELVGGNAPEGNVVVRGIQAFHEDIERAEAGLNVGLLLRRMSKESVERGMVAVAPGSVQPRLAGRARVIFLRASEGGRHTPVRSGYMPQLWFGATDITATIEVPTPVAPGDKAVIDFALCKPIALEPGMRFAMREGGRTVGAGVVESVR